MKRILPLLTKRLSIVALLLTFFSVPTFAYTESVTCNPADGSTVESLQSFILTWENDANNEDDAICQYYYYLKNYPESGDIRLLNENDEVVASYGLIDGNGNNTTKDLCYWEDPGEFGTLQYNQVAFSFDEAITDPGTYTLVFPQGVMFVNSWSDCNSEQRFTFTIEASSGVTYEFTPTSVDPVNNSSVTSISTITLTFDEDVYYNSTLETSVYMTGARAAYYPTVTVSGSTATLTFDTEVTTVASYALTIPEGTFGNAEYSTSEYTAGNANSALVYNYSVVSTAQYDYTVTPESGSTVESLSTITLQWPNEDNVEINWDHGNIIVKDADGNTLQTITSAEEALSYSPDNDYSKVILTLPTEITDPGTYTVTIPEGAVWIQTWTDSPEMELTYTIAAAEPEYDLVPTISPEGYSEIDSSEGLSEIKLTFDVDVYLNPNIESESLITLVQGRQSFAVTVSVDETDNKTVVITVDEPITTNGTYTLMVEEGAIGDQECSESGFTAGHANAYMYTRYYVVTPYDEVVTCDPADGSTVESLQTFILTWVNDEEVGQYYYPDGDICLYDADNNLVASYGLVDENGETTYKDVYVYWNDGYEYLEPNQVTFSFDEAITAPGTYTLVIPAGMMNVNDWYDYSTEQRFTFTISTSGINTIRSDSKQSGDIYTIGGVKVNNATKKGIYIVGGKKVVVK